LLTYLLTYLLIYFVRSFVHLFIHSCAHPFVRSLKHFSILHLLQAARKAKNRLSAALLVSGENTEEVPKSHKRRPTVSVKKPKADSISEENLAVDKDIEDEKKEEKEDGFVFVKDEKKSPMVSKKAKAPEAPKLTVSHDLGRCSWFSYDSERKYTI